MFTIDMLMPPTVVALLSAVPELRAVTLTIHGEKDTRDIARITVERGQRTTSVRFTAGVKAYIPGSTSCTWASESSAAPREAVERLIGTMQRLYAEASLKASRSAKRCTHESSRSRCLREADEARAAAERLAKVQADFAAAWPVVGDAATSAT